MLGQDLLILGSDSSTPIVAGARSCDIQKEREMIETASPSSGTARTYIAGRTGWSISLSTLVTSPATDLSKVDDSTPVTIKVKVRGGSVILTGQAYFKRCVISAALGNLCKGRFELQGTGPLAPPTQ
jgi:predicted secreted protein